MNGPILKPMLPSMTFDQYCGMRLMEIEFQRVMDAFGFENETEELSPRNLRQFPDFSLLN